MYIYVTYVYSYGKNYMVHICLYIYIHICRIHLCMCMYAIGAKGLRLRVQGFRASGSKRSGFLVKWGALRFIQAIRG